jgi:hypothetical protein
MCNIQCLSISFGMLKEAVGYISICDFKSCDLKIKILECTILKRDF